MQGRRSLAGAATSGAGGGRERSRVSADALAARRPGPPRRAAVSTATTADCAGSLTQESCFVLLVYRGVGSEIGGGV